MFELIYFIQIVTIQISSLRYEQQIPVIQFPVHLYFRKHIVIITGSKGELLGLFYQCHKGGQFILIAACLLYKSHGQSGNHHKNATRGIAITTLQQAYICCRIIPYAQSFQNKKISSFDSNASTYSYQQASDAIDLMQTLQLSLPFASSLSTSLLCEDYTVEIGYLKVRGGLY